MHRFDVARHTRVVAERFPEFANAHHERAVADLGTTPDETVELTLGHQLSGAIDEADEHGK